MKTRAFILAAALLMLALSSYPQQPGTVKPAPPPTYPSGGGQPKAVVKAPSISDSLKARFFKAQLTLRTAQEAFQRAQQASMEASGEITKACGDGFAPQMDPQGDPVCAAKPEVKKP